jgi:5-methylcytosine-specific restriction endonuclease McrA
MNIYTARRKIVNDNSYWDSRAATLNAYAERKGASDRITGVQLKQLYLESYGECFWCGKAMVLGKAYTPGQRDRVMSFDHVIRLVDEGTNTMDNLVCSCRKCNGERKYET